MALLCAMALFCTLVTMCWPVVHSPDVQQDTMDTFAQMDTPFSRGHENMARLLNGYGDEMYKIMRDDKPRTNAYRDAIVALAPGKVVLDIGTVSCCWPRLAQLCNCHC